MQIEGKIKSIGETETFGTNGFKKRELVVTTQEQYPQHILVEFVQDKTDLLNNYKIGQDVVVSINLRGREWVNPQGETKYFNSINGWRIESKPLTVEQGAKAIDKHIPPASPEQAFEKVSDSDLPF